MTAVGDDAVARRRPGCRTRASPRSRRAPPGRPAHLGPLTVGPITPRACPAVGQYSSRQPIRRLDAEAATDVTERARCADASGRCPVVTRPVVGAAPVAAVVVVPVPAAVSVAMPCPGSADAIPAPTRSPAIPNAPETRAAAAILANVIVLIPYDLFSPDLLATLPVLSAPIILACNGFGEIAGVEHLRQTQGLAVFVDRAPHSAECAANCPARCDDSARSSVPAKTDVVNNGHRRPRRPYTIVGDKGFPAWGQPSVARTRSAIA